MRDLNLFYKHDKTKPAFLWATFTKPVLFGAVCVLQTVSLVHFQDSSPISIVFFTA